MKKYALLLPLVVVMLFVLTACNDNDVQEVNTTINNAQANAPAATAYPDIYLFHESTDMGIYFSIHPAWYGLFGTIESLAEHDEGNTNTLVAYHIATRNEFGMGESGGVLFWINRLPNGLFAEVSEGFTGIILAQRAGYVYTLNYPRGYEYLYDSDSATTAQYLDMMGYLQPWDDNFVTNSFRVVGTNPFAEALLEFFEGGVETPAGVDATKAFTHTIGDIPVMVAIRHEVRAEETGHDQPIPVARVFYFIGGVLNYKDIETFQDRPPLIVLSGGLALFGGGWSNQWTTLLGIENGNLTHTLTLFYMLDADDISGENPQYYIRHGEWRWQDGYENLTPITQEEFYDILNTREFTRWEDVFDVTERILASELWGSIIPTPESRTIEELSLTITTVGGFWEEWWSMTGIFNPGHIDDTPWEYWIERPYDPRSMGFNRMLPESGYTSEDCIRNILLQFYTPLWIDVNVFGRGLVEHEETAVLLSGAGIPFMEYDGELFVMTARMGAIRPDWTTATHALIEQSGNRAVVETVVTTYDHMGVDGEELPTATIRFIFIDGRIDSGRGIWEWPE